MSTVFAVIGVGRGARATLEFGYELNRLARAASELASGQAIV